MGLPDDIPSVGLRPGKKGFWRREGSICAMAEAVTPYTHPDPPHVLRTTVHTIFSKPPGHSSLLACPGAAQGRVPASRQVPSNSGSVCPFPRSSCWPLGREEHLQGVACCIYSFTATAQERRQLCKQQAMQWKGRVLGCPHPVRDFQGPPP